MPPGLLDSQLATLEPLAPDEAGATVDADQPRDAVVDALLQALRDQHRIPVDGAARPASASGGA